MKKLRGKLLIVVVLLVALGSLYLIEDRFMGRVVWEPTTVPSNCSDGYIEDLWDEVFSGSADGLTTLQEFSGDQCNFATYKIIDGGQYNDIYMLTSLRDPTYDVLVSWNGSQWNINETFSLTATYINGTPGLAAHIQTFDEYSDFMLQAGQYEFLDKFQVGDWENVTNNSVDSSAAAKTRFEEVFSITGLGTFMGLITLGGGNPAAPFNYQQFEEENDFPHGESLEAIVIEEEDYMRFSLQLQEATIVTPPPFNGPIPNYTFEVNSDWNDAFVLADYFGLEPGVNVGVEIWGYNNSQGAWINYSVSGGIARFKPTAGFNGSREFQMVAMSTQGNNYSNYFWVHIVPDVDYPPVFQGEIVDFVINRTTNVTLLLDQFFEDPDGLDLTYTTSPVAENVGISFGWTKAYLWLKPNFTNYESFRIVASDGVHSTNSNLFTVYLDNNSGGSGPVVDPDDGSLLVTPGNASDIGTLGNGTTEGDSGDKSNIGFWIMVISGAILFLLIIGTVVYFAFFAKAPAPPPAPNKNMSNYLQKIRERGAPPQGVVTPPTTVAGVPVDRSAVENYLKKINGPQ